MRWDGMDGCDEMGWIGWEGMNGMGWMDGMGWMNGMGWDGMERDEMDGYMNGARVSSIVGIR